MHQLAVAPSPQPHSSGWPGMASVSSGKTKVGGPPPQAEAPLSVPRGTALTWPLVPWVKLSRGDSLAWPAFPSRHSPRKEG